MFFAKILFLKFLFCRALFQSAQHISEKREGSGSVPLTNRSRSGSRRPKNMRIRIPNTGTNISGSGCQKVENPLKPNSRQCLSLYWSNSDSDTSCLPFAKCHCVSGWYMHLIRKANLLPLCIRYFVKYIHFEQCSTYILTNPDKKFL